MAISVQNNIYKSVQLTKYRPNNTPHYFSPNFLLINDGATLTYLIIIHNRVHWKRWHDEWCESNSPWQEFINQYHKPKIVIQVTIKIIQYVSNTINSSSYVSYRPTDQRAPLYCFVFGFRWLLDRTMSQPNTRKNAKLYTKWCTPLNQQNAV